MPYIYSVYQIEWSADLTKYKKHLLHKGTMEELVESEVYCSAKNVRQLYSENIRGRMEGETTKKVWEREWKPEPGEKKPPVTLPDKVDTVTPPSRHGARSIARYNRMVEPEHEYKKPKTTGSSLLEQDIRQLVEDNRVRALQGKPPLSYGRWRAGLR